MATPRSQMGDASKFLAALLASGVLCAPAHAQKPVGWSSSWQAPSAQPPVSHSRQWWSHPTHGAYLQQSASLGQGGYHYPSFTPAPQRSGYFRRSREASRSAAAYSSQQSVSATPPAVQRTVAQAGAARTGLFGGLKRFFSRQAEPAPKPAPAQPAGPVMEGTASWYGRDFHGGPTASGERYNMYSFTAAHRTLPFGTLVKVTNLRNGRDVVVRINNRGPYIKGRIIDLSKGAAAQIGMVGSGLARVRMEIIGREG